MNYSNGEKIHVGDKVQLWDNCIGIVVCSIDDEEYNSKYTKADWNYLNNGLLIEAESLELIHYTSESDSELTKIVT